VTASRPIVVGIQLFLQLLIRHTRDYQKLPSLQRSRRGLEDTGNLYIWDFAATGTVRCEQTDPAMRGRESEKLRWISADQSILVSTPRKNTLSDWSLRQGAPKVPHQKKIWGAPRLSDQSDRVFILGVETSSLFGNVS
jgi:hypothetical protein